MFIDILTQDEFKRSVNKLYYRKLEIVAFDKKELKKGLHGHLIYAVDDTFSEQIKSDSKSKLKPGKFVGNFLVYTNKVVSIINHKMSTVEVRFLDDDEEQAVGLDKLFIEGFASLIQLDLTEYGSTWWIIPKGISL